MFDFANFQNEIESLCRKYRVKRLGVFGSALSEDFNENSDIDLKTKAAVEREFEIVGEALNRIKKIDLNILKEVDNWREIIGFRNVIAHGYDVVEDEIVWDSVNGDIPILLKQSKTTTDGCRTLTPARSKVLDYRLKLWEIGDTPSLFTSKELPVGAKLSS